MGRPSINENPMSSAERKQRQAELEKSRKVATKAAILSALHEVFKKHVTTNCLQPKLKYVPALSIAWEVARLFPVELRDQVLADLGMLMEPESEPELAPDPVPKPKAKLKSQPKPEAEQTDIEDYLREYLGTRNPEKT